MKTQNGSVQADILMRQRKFNYFWQRSGLRFLRSEPESPFFALPLSILSLLVSLLMATSRYYAMPEVMTLLVPLLAITFCLTILGDLVHPAEAEARAYERASSCDRTV
jgi:hypothetical protein